MRNFIWFFLVLLLMVYACQEQEKDLTSELFKCGNLGEPIAEIPWLKEAVDKIEVDTSFSRRYVSISQASYNSRTVFFFGNCCPNCVTEPVSVYDCEREILGRIGVEIGKDELENTATIYRPDNFECDE